MPIPVETTLSWTTDFDTKFLRRLDSILISLDFNPYNRRLCEGGLSGLRLEARKARDRAARTTQGMVGMIEDGILLFLPWGAKAVHLHVYVAKPVCSWLNCSPISNNNVYILRDLKFALPWVVAQRFCREGRPR
jgi:hypothetical protein